MRNLKRYFAVAIAIAMLLTLMAPAIAATSNDYSKEAGDLNAIGLYQGIDPNKFNPDLGSTLDRQTAAVFLARLAGLEKEANDMDLTEAKGTLKAKFKDASSIADWAAKHVALYADSGVIAGFPDGTFQPKALVTGKQFCTLMLKQLGYSDFKFEEAAAKYGEVASLSADEQAAFGTNSSIKKSILIGIAYSALEAKLSGKTTTLVDQLVKDGVVAKEEVEKVGIVLTPEPTKAPATSTPATTGTATATPTGVAPVVYGAINTTVEMTAAKSVAGNQALVEVGKIKFTSDKDLTVTGVKLQRTGLSADADISSLTVWDGTSKLNVSAIFSNGLSDITFTNAVNVKAGVEKVLVIKMNVDDGAPAGSQIVISLVQVKAPSNVTVNGTLPVASGTITIANVDLGEMTVAVSADAPADESNQSAGKGEVRLAKYDFSAATEAQTLKVVTFTQNGNVADSDLANLKLYDGATKIADGKVENRTVTFTFEKEILAGATARLTLKGEIVGGAGREIQFGIADENDIQALGKTYGTTIVGSLQVDGEDASEIDGNTININQGSFLASRADTCPAAATIGTSFKDQKFASFKVESIGETIQLRTFNVGVTVNGITSSQLRNLKLVSGTTTLFSDAAPFDDDVTNQNITLSTPIDVVPGTPVIIDVTCDSPAEVGGVAVLVENDTITFSLSAVGTQTITGVGRTSGRTATLDLAAAIDGNIMTVGDLSTTIARVAASDDDIFQNAAGVKVIDFDISHNLGESVDISTIVVGFTPGANTHTLGANFRNAKLLDSTGKAISDTVSTLSTADESIDGNTNVSFPLIDPLTVAKGQTVRVSLSVDVISDANAGDTYTFNIAATSVARTTAAGTVVPVDATDDGGKVVTVSAGGSNVLAVRNTALDITSANVYAGDTNVQIGAYTFFQLDGGVEPAKVTSLKLARSESREDSVAEVTNITLGGAYDAEEDVTVTLRNADNTATVTVNHVMTVSDDLTAQAAELANAINSDATASTLYWAASTAAVVQVTRKETGHVNDIAVAEDSAAGTIAAAVATQGTDSNCEVTELTVDNTPNDGDVGDDDDSVAITLRNAANTGNIVVTVTLVADDTDNAAATDIAAAINDDAAAGELYLAEVAADVVTITRRVGGACNDITAVVTEDENAGDAGPATVAVEVTTAGAVIGADALAAQHFNNIRITDTKGNVLGKVNSISDSAINLDSANPFIVPAFSTSPVPDRCNTIIILADVLATAPYADTISVRLGNRTATDIQYQAVNTGLAYTSYCDLAAGDGVDALFTTGAAKMTVTAKAIADTTPINSATSAEVARFTIKNNSSRYITLNHIQLEDLKDNMEDNTDWTDCTIARVSNGTELAAGTAATGDFNLAGAGNAVAFSPQQEIEFVVYADLNAISAATSGISYQVKVEADGTFYQVTGDAANTEMTVDNDAACSAVVTVDP